MALERCNCQTRLLRFPLLFAVWQTGADCAFYYHFNDAILAARPDLTRLPLANVFKVVRACKLDADGRLS